MSATLRRAVYMGPGRVVVEDSPAVTPDQGAVRIDVAYTGICGTDLHVIHGHMDGRVSVPATIGHEMSGTIAALGAGVVNWRIGDHVTVLPLDPCGECPACVCDHRHLCHRLNFMGIDSTGSMQQSWVVPAATLVALPPSLSLRTAALVEPVAVAVHDVGRAGVAEDDHVLVVGGGPIGVLIALVAEHAGAHVALVEPDSFRRGIAEDLGLTAIDPTVTDVNAWVDVWTRGTGADIAFEVSGAEGGVATAVDSLAARGRLCLVAIHPEPRAMNLHRFFWRELTLVGARLYTRADFATAIDHLSRGVISAEAMISAVVPLTESASAFSTLERGGKVLKILIDCQA